MTLSTPPPGRPTTSRSHLHSPFAANGLILALLEPPIYGPRFDQDVSNTRQGSHTRHREAHAQPRRRQ